MQHPLWSEKTKFDWPSLLLNLRGKKIRYENVH